MVIIGLILVLGVVFGGAVGFIVGYFTGGAAARRKLGRGFPVETRTDRAS